MHNFMLLSPHTHIHILYININYTVYDGVDIEWTKPNVGQQSVRYGCLYYSQAEELNIVIIITCRYPQAIMSLTA